MKMKSLTIMKFLPTFILIISLLITSSVQAATYVWENVGAPGFSAGSAYWTSLAIDNSGTPYVAYQDRGNDYKATVMTYTEGTGWVPVGSAGFSAGQPDYISLAIDNNSGTPYLSYRDAGDSFKATVMKFDGTNWVLVGPRGFSAPTGYTSLAIDNSGTPYIAYQDGGENSSKATVRKFNGTSWVLVGSDGFSAGQADYISLAIDNSGTPYVAYQDDGNSSKATVMKFNGISWEDVGSAGFSAGQANFISLAIDNNSGTPYVAYQDNGNSSRATVMKFNGISWEDVGSAGLPNWASYTSMAIDDSGTPYVAYKDFYNSSKATVKKFDGTDWVPVGSAGFSAGGANYISLAIDNNGAPYVAYQDAVNSSKATVMKGRIEIDLNDTSLSRSAVSDSETDVGTLTPTGGISPFVFSLQQSGSVCTAENGLNNGLFTISGNTLQRKPTTPLGSYKVCVQVVDSTTANDQHAYTINVVNALSDLTLDNQTIPDDRTNVGDFSATGGTGSLIYTLETSGDVCNTTNGGDNASFSISGTTLQRESGTTAGTYDICAQAEDSYGLTTQGTFTITLSAAPSDLTLSNTSLPETRTIVGTLATVDGQPVYVYSLQTSGATCTALNGADNLLFDIEGNALKRKSTTTAGVYDICIQTLDQNGSIFQKTFAITVTADATPPVSWDADLSSTHLIDGDGPGTVVGGLLATIPGVTYQLTDLAAFPLASNFSINATGQLVLTGTADYSTARNYPIRILATAPDGSKAYLDYVITIMQDGTTAGAMGIEDSVKTKGVISIDVLSNDLLSSGATSWDFHEIIEYPQHGTAEIGSVVYTPNRGYIGEDSVSYRACDDLGFCVTALVTITVEEVPFPETGFAPGRVTQLSAQPEDQLYQAYSNLLLEIPALNIQTGIIGVPISAEGWDLTWLGGQAGWLHGTAFPTWAGNSAITAHVVDANGQPGLFNDLNTLKYGDTVIVKAYGQTYEYQVRIVDDYVDPDDTSSVFKHEKYPWLTLITCKGYDEENDSYRWRVVVRAVQTKIY